MMLAECWQHRGQSRLCVFAPGSTCFHMVMGLKQTGCSSLEGSRVGERALCTSSMTYRPDGFRSAKKGKKQRESEMERGAPYARPP
jgi:hypothetical protein